MSFNTILTAETNGIITAYCEAGVGEPLLMLNGGAAERCEYRRFVPYIADGIRIISYDQRDFGDTVSGSEPYTLKTLADDAIGLMDALGLARAHLIGFSYGGVVALQAAIHHPERVHSLIVGTAPYRYGDMIAAAETLTGLSPSDLRRRTLELCLSPKGQADARLVAELTEGDSARKRTPDTNSGVRRTGAAAGYDMAGLGRKISAPTLLIYGRGDPKTPPEIGQRLKQEIPNSHLAMIEGGRHSFFREFPVEVAKLTSDWVLSHPIGNDVHP